ncbi:threonine aldolase family protein [Clostridium sp. 'White wine YQ']|uniref:threonine aldolase family protein n=1 Tax=Clostridium sp. 'White wine YQ' TaxID=3027474 RepID=UPI0023660065|nr:aminotransferase class I/II-fold pyridoxal phosphate-dependent enzyme [Clostridium sp. 'White wine YQ']MDD7794179.1 aminotransferase class I/II-fold pyridoxal phosphate-dependent enzyme [Clostridium sp. 'White wine YQ']
MYSFKNDYSEGAHPRILNALIESNLEQTEGYGEDKYSLEAIEILKSKIQNDTIDIHFFVGGTQTNLTAISAFLRPHEAAIATNTGHILVHETGAIEATGHKAISINVPDGKLRPSDIQLALDEHTDEHMVKPKLVYISNSTEIGTIYSKSELENLSYFCKEKNLFLFLDGARLGSALCSNGNDLELSDLANLTDAFYIGGTKNGALLGEALVICNNSLKEDFRFHIKQKGAMLAKGKVLGIQFLELFKDDLYFELAKHANKMADLLKEGIDSMGYKYLIDSPSNQIFPIFPNSIIKKLKENYAFIVWSKVDDNFSSIRLVTSWATKEQAVNDFINDLKSLS